MATNARQYASGTTVNIGRSKEQIEADLRRMGGTRYAFFNDEEAGRAVVMFEREHVRYRLILPLPDPNADKYRWTPARRFRRDAEQQREAWEQDCRERWRALAEYIKMLRVAWEAGIIKLEEALLSSVMLGNGQSVGEYILPGLATSLERHELPPLLPGVSPRAHIVALPAPEED